MIVLDASAAVDWLRQTPAGQRIENRIYSRNETRHTPHLLDLEVIQVLRRRARPGVVPVLTRRCAICWIFALLAALISCSSPGFGNCVPISLPMMLPTLCGRKARSRLGYTGRS